MHQELAYLTVTFPLFVSLLLVSCLKSAWKFKGEQETQNNSEAYVKTKVVESEQQIPKKSEKKVKKTDGKEKKEKKGKKLSKFFIFNGKDDELKTAVAAEEISLDSTQNSDSDDEHESIIGDQYEFSGEERLPGIELLPSPPADYVAKLKARVRRGRRGKKSPQDYYCPEEEDSLFNIPSLMHDQVTLKSSKSNLPLEIQDSRILRLHQDNLGYKKSHTVYPSTSPTFSNRVCDESTSASRSSSEANVTIVQH